MRHIESQYGWRILRDGSAERTLSPREDKEHKDACRAMGINYIPSRQTMFRHEVEQMLNRGWQLKIHNTLTGAARKGA